MIKTAICIAGTARQIDHTFDNLRNYLIENIENSDTIVYITENSESDKARLLFEKLDNTYVHVVKEEPIDIEPFQFVDMWPPSQGSNLGLARQIFMQMLKSRSYLNTLIDQNEKDLDTKYDRVIFSRMDVVYQQPVYGLIKNLELSPDVVWIPSFHNWLSGYNDRFVVSSKEGAYKYLSLYDYVTTYADHKHIFRAEATLKYHLSCMNVETRHFDILFSRYRNGKEWDTPYSLTQACVEPYKEK